MNDGPSGEQRESGDAAPDLVAGIRTLTVRPAAEGVVFVLNGNEPRAAEQYRIIRTKVLLARRPVRVLCISSPQVGDGKSVTAVNLAAVLALKLGQSVLLADADFRRSSLARLLGAPLSPGLADVLRGECGWEQAVFRLESPANLFFLPAGVSTSHPAELFDSPLWGGICTELRRNFHCVVLDSPPVGLVADYFLIEAAADGVILVVRPDHTRRSLCFRALETVPAEKLLGVVINMAPNGFLSRRMTHAYPHEADWAQDQRATDFR